MTEDTDTAVAEPQSLPKLRVEAQQEFAAEAQDAAAFVEACEFDDVVRLIVAAHAEPGKDYADVGGRRYVACADGTTQIAVARVNESGQTVYDLLHHQTPDDSGKAEFILHAHRTGDEKADWREEVLTIADKAVPKQPSEQPATVSPFRKVEV